jgi:hypothetical protein
MARQEQDREDLLKEATALVERAELALPDRAEQVIVGFRRDGCASFYFGPDEAYHFNSQLLLRRAYVDGRLLKAERGRLVALVRHRQAGEVQLLRHELSSEETVQFLDRLITVTGNLRRQLERGTYQLIGQVPGNVDVTRRIQTWLEALPATPSIAARPNAC